MSASAQAASQSQNGRYEALLRAAQSIAACHDCDSTANCLASKLHDVVDFDYLQVLAFDTDAGTLWQLSERNRKLERASHVGFSDFADTPAAWVQEHGEPLIISDWNQETRFTAYRQEMRELGVQSSCALALVRGQRRLGVLGFGSLEANAYTTDELSFLTLVADQLALALD